MKSIFDMEKNHTLKLAESSELGWEMALSHNFDLILMDINLPGISGRELAEKLRETEQYKNKPIIAVSACVMKSDTESTRGVFDAYISKPFQVAELLSVVEEQLK